MSEGWVEFHVWVEEKYEATITDAFQVAELVDEILTRDIPPDKVTIYRHDMEEFQEAVRTEIQTSLDRLNGRRKKRK